jgi:hypothetical protein
MIERGELPGEQLKRGAFVGKASKAQILELIEELYGGYDWYRPGTHLYAQAQELVAYVNVLLDDKEYALVASDL